LYLILPQILSSQWTQIFLRHSILCFHRSKSSKSYVNYSKPPQNLNLEILSWDGREVIHLIGHVILSPLSFIPHIAESTFIRLFSLKLWAAQIQFSVSLVEIYTTKISLQFKNHDRKKNVETYFFSSYIYASAAANKPWQVVKTVPKRFAVAIWKNFLIPLKWLHYSAFRSFRSRDYELETSGLCDFVKSSLPQSFFLPLHLDESYFGDNFFRFPLDARQMMKWVWSDVWTDSFDGQKWVKSFFANILFRWKSFEAFERWLLKWCLFAEWIRGGMGGGDGKNTAEKTFLECTFSALSKYCGFTLSKFIFGCRYLTISQTSQIF
jgi:hypothetical protein